MKILYTVIFFCVCSLNTTFAQHKLTKLWETDSVLKVPESVLLDRDNKVLYVSNIDGTDPWGADGKGSVGKVGLDGKIIATDWVTGLNSPKGLGLHKGKLYVADLSNIVVIDTKKSAIETIIKVDGAGGLNARIFIQPRRGGEHKIIATSGSKEYGDFTLTVQTTEKAEK